MQTSPLTMIPLRRLKVLPNNPRTITQAKLNQLCDSIRENDCLTRLRTLYTAVVFPSHPNRRRARSGHRLNDVRL